MKYGLVLEGGGAKGAFHVGALKALYERGYEFGGVTGTSIGALNGAIVAQGDFETLYEVWQRAMPSMLVDAKDDMLEKILGREYDKESVKYLLKLVRTYVANKGVPIDKARAFLDTYIDEDKLRASSIDYGLVTVDTSGEWEALEVFKEDIPKGMLKQYILASAYFPLFNRPMIDGKSYIDGGVYNNCPVNPLIYKGYNKIIAIRTGSKMPSRKVIDGTAEVTYIEPSELLGNTIDFRNEHVKYNMRLGYYDAIRVTDGLLGERYYVKNTSPTDVLNYFENIDYKVYSEWANMLGINGNKRVILRAVADVGARVLELSAGAGMTEVLVRLLEREAKKAELERFRVYSVIEFTEEVLKKMTTPDDVDIASALLRVLAKSKENDNG